MGSGCGQPTLGKIFARLRIARIDGRPPGVWRLAGRGLLQYLPLLTLGVFYLLFPFHVGPFGSILIGVFLFALVDHFWALTNRNRRTLHDLLLSTWVLDR